MARRRGRRRTEKQRRARRLGLRAVAAFATIASLAMIATVWGFRLNANQIVVVVVLEAAISSITCRFVYLAVSRYTDPSWKVERLAYASESAWVDAERVTISKPSHIAERSWSRRFSVFVLVFWCSAWALTFGGIAYLSGTTRGLRTNVSSPTHAPKAPTKSVTSRG